MTKQHETPTPRLPSNKKLLGAIITAALSVGAALGYVVPPAVGSGGGEGVRELRATHERDIGAVRESLDALTASAAKSEAKLDLLVQMLRDHTNGGAK